MHSGDVACLMFVSDGEENAGTISSLLGEQGVCVARSGEAKECLELLGARSWRLLIVDTNGDVGGSLEVLAQARRIRPDVPVLVLVRGGDVATTVEAMKAGAADCIETPVEAVRLRAAVAPLCRRADGESRSLRAGLTRVERVVLWHVLDGQTNRQIADALSRSPRTIEVHRRHIMSKLGAATLIELVRQAIRAGMVDCTGRQAPELACALHERTSDAANA